MLKNAPHTAAKVLAEDWSLPYTREKAAFPASWVRAAKFWPAVSRVDNVYGDRNLIARLEEMAPASVSSPPTPPKRRLCVLGASVINFWGYHKV